MLYAISYSGVVLIEASSNDEALEKFATLKKKDITIHVKHIEETTEE